MLLAHVVLDLTEEQRRQEESCLGGDFSVVQGVLPLAVHSKQGALAEQKRCLPWHTALPLALAEYPSELAAAGNAA